jgi:hypothetical protein
MYEQTSVFYEAMKLEINLNGTIDEWKPRPRSKHSTQDDRILSRPDGVEESRLKDLFEFD